MAKLFTLSTEERLKSRKDIETLFRSGKAFFIFPFKVIFRFDENKAGSIQFMVSVPKKQFKRATVRNRIKRQTREGWRTQNIALKELVRVSGRTLQIAFLFQSKEMLPYTTLSDTLMKSILRLEEMIRKKS